MWLVQPPAINHIHLSCCLRNMLLQIILFLLLFDLQLEPHPLVEYCFCRFKHDVLTCCTFTLNIRSSPTFERRMTLLATMLTRRKSFCFCVHYCCRLHLLCAKVLPLVFLPLVFLSLVKLQFCLQCSFHIILVSYYPSLFLDLQSILTDPLCSPRK